MALHLWRGLFYLLLMVGSPEPQCSSNVKSATPFCINKYKFNIIIMKRISVFILLFFVLLFNIQAQTYTLYEKWVDCGNGCQLLDPYYSDGVTFTWDGSVKNGKAHGYGVATKFKNGQFESKYEGIYKNGIREGKGQFTHADGSIKTGHFVNGQLVGQGKMTTEDGHTYDGCFVNYRMHGQGTIKYANGASFVGFVADNAPHTGTFTNYDGTITYLQQGNPVEKITSVASKYLPKIGQRVTEYFDKDWNRCEAKTASYYRLITYSAPNTPKGVVKDYYITGELQSEQYPIFIDYSDESRTFLEGEQTFYHKNGKIERKQQYYNNQLNGPSISYYEDGKIASEINFVHGVPNGDAVEYYPNGKIATVRKFNGGQLHNNKYLYVTEDETIFLTYEEDFFRNRETWEFRGQNGIVQVNDAESISLQASPERTISGGIYTGFSPMSDNIISVLTNQRNPGQGVISFLFGYKDWDNMCAFSIAGNQFQFTYIKNGVTVQSDEWQVSEYINPDVNQLMIINSEDKIKLFINDKLVKEVGRIYYDGSLCGISLYNPGSQPIVADVAQLMVHEVIEPHKIPQEYLPEEKSDPNAWKGNGSGFFLNQEGYIATNYHVVEGASAIQANFTRNGKVESYPATVVAADQQNDLAIIKINDTSYKNVSQLPYGLLSRTKDTGSEVFALGYPMADVMGDEVKFTDGKISSRSGIQGDIRVYQISVPIQPGNSGGPLFDMNGNIVGITSSGLNRDYFKSENVNYAIKASYLKTLMESCPQKIVLEEKEDISITKTSLTEKIKQYEDFVVLILTK